MAQCPNGHESTADDYCDTCGILMGGAAPSATASSPGGSAPSATPATTPTGMVTPEVSAGDCPNCGAARAGDERFCEVCGMDFETGRMPEPPQPAAAPTLSTDPAATGSPAPEPPGIGWHAIVSCDRDWWQDNTGAGGVADGVPFPDPVPAERRVALRQASSVIGRTSGSSVADVDCGGADTGVSRKHVQISLAADGSWTVTDLGSTNGTFVGGTSTRLSPQSETALDPAAAIKIGAFTVIRLEPEPPTS